MKRLAIFVVVFGFLVSSQVGAKSIFDWKCQFDTLCRNANKCHSVDFSGGQFHAKFRATGPVLLEFSGETVRLKPVGSPNNMYFSHYSGAYNGTAMMFSLFAGGGFFLSQHGLFRASPISLKGAGAPMADASPTSRTFFGSCAQVGDQTE